MLKTAVLWKHAFNNIVATWFISYDSKILLDVVIVINLKKN